MGWIPLMMFMLFILVSLIYIEHVKQKDTLHDTFSLFI